MMPGIHSIWNPIFKKLLIQSFPCIIVLPGLSSSQKYMGVQVTWRYSKWSYEQLLYTHVFILHKSFLKYLSLKNLECVCEHLKTSYDLSN